MATRRKMSPEREAEELRSGIEKLIEGKAETVYELLAFDSAELAILVSDVRALLDNVDARDSLKFLEKRARRAKRGGSV